MRPPLIGDISRAEKRSLDKAIRRHEALAASGTRYVGSDGQELPRRVVGYVRRRSLRFGAGGVGDDGVFGG